MIYAFALSLLFLAVLVHEIGHAIAMIKTGVGVRELGIGLPYGPRLACNFTARNAPNETFTLSIYPLLIGAFVRPMHEKRILELSYKDKAFIYGAGIIANILFMCVCMILLRIWWPEINFRLFPEWIMLWMPIVTFGLVCWYARAVSAYIFPIISIAVMYWLVSTLLTLTPTQLVDNAGGIILAGQIAQSFSNTIPSAIYFGGVISFALGATNILPIYPLDGGLTTSTLVEKFAPRLRDFFNRIGFGLFLVLIFYSVGGDVRRLWLMTQ